MKNKLFFTLILGAMLGSVVTGISFAQSTTGSEGGAVQPGVSTHVTPNAAAGSAGSAPETSLSSRGFANPSTRESDAPREIAKLAPVALLMFLVLAGCLYWFVFRKPTTSEGETATTGTNRT